MIANKEFFRHQAEIIKKEVEEKKAAVLRTNEDRALFQELGDSLQFAQEPIAADITASSLLAAENEELKEEVAKLKAQHLASNGKILLPDNMVMEVRELPYGIPLTDILNYMKDNTDEREFKTIKLMLHELVDDMHRDLVKQLKFTNRDNIQYFIKAQEFVQTKNVQNQVSNVEPGATGFLINQE